MIWWKVKVGFSKTPYVTSLTEIAFLDDSYLTVPLVKTIPSSTIYNRYKTENEAAEYLESYIGADYYTMYGALCSFDSKRYDAVSKICPSSILAYPNINELKTNMCTYFYIPSLNRIIASNTTSCSVGKVSNGIISYVGQSVDDFNFIAQNFYFYYLKDDYDDITNVNNWGCGDCGYVSSSPNFFVRLIPPASIKNLSAFLVNLFEENKIPDGVGPIPSTDPYDPIDPSGPTDPNGGGDGPGGNGNFDDTSDPITLPTIPTLSSANTGFTRIYNPTLSQVQDLASYLWTDDSVIDTIWNHIKQFMENPMDAIIGFNVVPVPVPDGGTQEFKLMYIPTGVNMTVAASQFVDVDCGTLEIKPYYGSYLDYAPTTQITCFLPYIGMVTLDVDEVMNTTLQVKYRVDICSGSCVAMILVNGNVLYQYSGHCAINIPISGADFSSYVSAAINVAKLGITAGAFVAAGAAGAGTVAAASQATGNITTQTVTTERNPATGRQITTGTVTTTRTVPPRQSTPRPMSTKAALNGLSPENIANTVGSVMSSKPAIQHSGSFSGNSGYLGVRRPYIVIQRPNICLPGNYQTLNGYPAMITMELGTCQGYTKVQQVQLTGMSATNPEQAEILELLKGGVIF